MSRMFDRSFGTLAVFSAAMLGIGGCGNNLPSSTTVLLPDGTETRATLGSGVIAFADSTWEFTQSSTAAQGSPFVSVVFGPNGELKAFENNTLASDIFGSTIIFDGQRHATTQPGLSYAAVTFGASTADATGFAFEAQFTAFAAGLEAASGTATASGTFDGDDVNSIRGTFTFTSRVTLLDIPEGNQDLKINFVGAQVE